MKFDTFVFMKRVCLSCVSVLLVGLFIYNSLGYYFVNQAIRLIHKQEVFALLSQTPDQLLVTIIIEKSRINELNIQGPKPEITIDGKKYDIKKLVDSGSSVKIYCKPDKYEDQIISKAQKVNNKVQNNKPVSKTAVLILDSIIKTALLSEDTNPVEPYQLVETGIIDSYSLLHPDLSVPFHPPQTGIIS
jgi:hypothetical protein